MANKPKPATKSQERDRRSKVEAMRKAQQAQEKRKSILFIAVAVVVGLGLIAAVAVPTYLKGRHNPANKALSAFGVSTDAASCQAVKTTPDTNTAALRAHVADGTTEKYKTVPPSYGPHWAQPAIPSLSFYTVGSKPPMEQLVHNLEHGYTVLWYDNTVQGGQLTALKNLSTSARNKSQTGKGKFIVSAWDPAFGAFPAGQHIAMSHWGSKSSVTQTCGKVSGGAVANFITKFPAADSPESAAA